MNSLNDSQVKILQYLAKLPQGMTIELKELEAKSGASCNSGNIGPVFTDVLENYPDSLHALGLVKPQRYEGEGTTWGITAKGRKLAATLKSRVKMTDPKIPPKMLDPILRDMKKSRTYGLESFVESDFKEIRDRLGEEYYTVSSASLAMQINNRRKQGAFVDPQDKIRRRVQAAIKDFGPKGEIQELWTKEQLEVLRSLLG